MFCRHFPQCEYNAARSREPRWGRARMYARPELSIVQNPACYVRASANSSRSIYGIDRSDRPPRRKAEERYSGTYEISGRALAASPPTLLFRKTKCPSLSLSLCRLRYCDRATKTRRTLTRQRLSFSLCGVQHRGIKENADVESALPPRRTRQRRNLRSIVPMSISSSRHARFNVLN